MPRQIDLQRSAWRIVLMQGAPVSRGGRRAGSSTCCQPQYRAKSRTLWIFVYIIFIALCFYCIVFGFIMSRKSIALSDSSDSSRVSVQATSVNLPDSHNQLDSVKPDKKKCVPERFGECKMSNGWIRCTSRFSHGREYFYNTLTGAKSWICPVSKKISLSDYNSFMVPGLTLKTSSQEDESPLALSSSEQPLPRNLIEILRFLNRLYPTSVQDPEKQYNYSEDQLNSVLCSTVLENCLGTRDTSFTDDNVQSLINTICNANVNGNGQSKPEYAENDDNDRGEVAICDKEVERGKNKERKENEEIYLKTSIPLSQTDKSTSSSSSSTSTTSSSNTSSSNTSSSRTSSTSINTTISNSISTTEVAALPVSPERPTTQLLTAPSGPSKEFAVPRLKTISFDDLQKSPVKPKLVPKRRYRRKTLQRPKPKPPRKPRGPEAIIREVGNVRTISYNHYVPPPQCSPKAVKRSNLSDSSYSTFSDAKRFAQRQTKGVLGKGFGQNFPIVINSLQLSEASSSASESSHD